MKPAGRDVRYMGKQSICCRMRVAPIPGWTPALPTALPRNAPQSRMCPLAASSQLTHPQTGEEGSRREPAQVE